MCFSQSTKILVNMFLYQISKIVKQEPEGKVFSISYKKILMKIARWTLSVRWHHISPHDLESLTNSLGANHSVKGSRTSGALLHVYV